MGSAHPLDEVNTAAKLEENPLIGIGCTLYRADTIMEVGGRTDRRTDATKRIQYSPHMIKNVYKI